jgi:hypothetical protein
MLNLYLNQIIKHHTKLYKTYKRLPEVSRSLQLEFHGQSGAAKCWSRGRDHWQDQPEDSRGTATTGCGWIEPEKVVKHRSFQGKGTSLKKDIERLRKMRDEG